MLERLILRTWPRNSEVFAQLVSGTENGFTSVVGTLFWLRVPEPDSIPINSNAASQLNQGVFVDSWGRPREYQVYKDLPASGRQLDTKEVNVENMLHPKFVRRLHQIQGVLILSGVSTHLNAPGKYEDTELIAAYTAATLGIYIKKGNGQSLGESNSSSDDDDWEMMIQPGMIYDDLKPGEDIDMVKFDRPNPNLETSHNGQPCTVATGSRLSFSSTARNCGNTYGAQWQKLVESIDGYLILQDQFTGVVTWPMYRAWPKMAAVVGEIKLPHGLDMESLYSTAYSGPVMPWIDLVKEVNAWKPRIRGGAATESDWVRASGYNLNDVKARRKTEIDESKEPGLVSDTDPANGRGGISAEAREPDVPPPESQCKR